MTIVGLTTLITPLAFLTAILQHRLVRPSVADLVIGLATSPTLIEIQTALRGVLRDPTLQLWLWLPAHRNYVNDSDQMAITPSDNDRWSIPILGQNAEPLAVLVLDPALQRHLRLVKSAVIATGLSLENGRLHTDLKKQLAEVRVLRARIVEAGMVERRRIEQDLHDGAQQSLLAVAATLGVARLHAASDKAALEAIDRARSKLQIALHDLRQLAHGIHPASLAQYGLSAALESITEGIPFPVKLTIPDHRWPPPIESAVYFLACEALTNAVKHAHATQAVIEIHSNDSGVAVRVSDNGRGGASPTHGGGLAGIVDRIHALGGRFDLNSSPGRGTTITAHISCA